MLATTCGGGIFLWEWLWSPEKLWGWLLDHILLREKLSVSSVSQPNFQFICHFFNQELNWKSQRAISLEKSMLTGRRSEQDWSELRSSNPTFDARDDGPLTHWRTPCVSLTPWLHKYISQFLFLEKCSTFKSDIFSQWWSMVQSIITQFTHWQYKV